MARISSGKILSIVMIVVMATVLFSVVESVLPTMVSATYDLFTGYNSTAIGTSANTFAATVPSLLGWFYVIAPLGLAVVVILGLFRLRR